MDYNYASLVDTCKWSRFADRPSLIYGLEWQSLAYDIHDPVKENMQLKINENLKEKKMKETWKP